MPKIGAFWIPKSGASDFMSGNLVSGEELSKAIAIAEKTSDGKGVRVFLKRSASENPKAPQWELHVSTPRGQGDYQRPVNAPVAAPARAMAPVAAAVVEEEGLPF